MTDMTPTIAFAHAPAGTALTTLRAAFDTLLTAIDTMVTAGNGTTQRDDVAVSGSPTGGTWLLTFTGAHINETVTVARAANAATVQAQVRLLTPPGFAAATVTTSGTTPNFTYLITLKGAHEAVTVTASAALLTGGSPVVTPSVGIAYAPVPVFSAGSQTLFKQKVVDLCEELASSLRV